MTLKSKEQKKLPGFTYLLDNVSSLRYKFEKPVNWVEWLACYLIRYRNLWIILINSVMKGLIIKSLHFTQWFDYNPNLMLHKPATVNYIIRFSIITICVSQDPTEYFNPFLSLLYRTSEVFVQNRYYSAGNTKQSWNIFMQ